MRMTSGSTAIARAMHSRCCWPPDRPSADLWRRSFTSSQRAALRRAFSTIAAQLSLRDAGDLGSVGHVVEDRLRERVRLLEDHADAASHLGDVDGLVVEVHAVEADLAADPRAADEVVHPVEATQHRRLAAARRPDQRGDLLAVDLHRHVVHSAVVAVVDHEVVDVEHDGAALERAGGPASSSAIEARSIVRSVLGVGSVSSGIGSTSSGIMTERERIWTSRTAPAR